MGPDCQHSRDGRATKRLTLMPRLHQDLNAPHALAAQAHRALKRAPSLLIASHRLQTAAPSIQDQLDLAGPLGVGVGTYGDAKVKRMRQDLVPCPAYGVSNAVEQYVRLLPERTRVCARWPTRTREDCLYCTTQLLYFKETSASFETAGQEPLSLPGRYCRMIPCTLCSTGARSLVKSRPSVSVASAKGAGWVEPGAWNAPRCPGADAAFSNDGKFVYNSHHPENTLARGE